MPETLVRSTRDVIEFLTNQHNLIKDMFDEVLLLDRARDAISAAIDSQ